MKPLNNVSSFKELAKVMKCSPERLIAAHLEVSLEPVLNYVKTGEGKNIPVKIKESIKHLRTLADLYSEAQTPVSV
jgi:hypothetical protein